jgi:isopenicillin N synthase-like dioxygenase
VNALPVIDFTPFRTGGADERRRVGEAIDAACRETGFLVLTGHGVPDALVADTREAFRVFFDQPPAYKRRFAKDPAAGAAGYSAIGDTALARTRGDAAPADLNETFNVVPPHVDRSDPYFTCEAARGFFPPNRFPDTPANLERLCREYYAAAYALARELLRACAAGLGLPEQFFDDKTDRAIATLVARNYPAQTEAPLRGQWRAAAHTDFGTMTLLAAEDRPGGLEVRTRHGTWLKVAPPRSAFVVNIGDMMARWTNDRWVSTLHRVANPPVDAGDSARRISLVFFMNPNYDAVVAPWGDPPRHSPVTVGDYYLRQMSRLRELSAPRPAG